MDKLEYIREAVRLSEENLVKLEGGPFGAIIVKGGKIIAKSSNQVIKKNDPTAHAEIEAIRLACKNLKTFSLEGCEIYSSCEPCPMCLSAIYWARVSKVYYANTSIDAASAGFDDRWIYQEIMKVTENRKMCMERIEIERAKDAFDKWKKLEGRIPY